jgi:hypothetical protein
MHLHLSLGIVLAAITGLLAPVIEKAQADTPSAEQGAAKESGARVQGVRSIDLAESLKLTSHCNVCDSAPLFQTIDYFLDACIANTELTIWKDQVHDFESLTQIISKLPNRPASEVQLGGVLLAESQSEVQFALARGVSRIDTLRRHLGLAEPISVICLATGPRIPDTLDGLLSAAASQNPCAIHWAQRVQDTRATVECQRCRLQKCESKLIQLHHCDGLKAQFQAALAELQAVEMSQQHFLRSLRTEIEADYIALQSVRSAIQTLGSVTPSTTQTLLTSAMTQYQNGLLSQDVVTMAIRRHHALRARLTSLKTEEMKLLFKLDVLVGGL